MKQMRNRVCPLTAILAVLTATQATTTSGEDVQSKPLQIVDCSAQTLGGMVKVDGATVSKSRNESIRYVPHVAAEFVDKATGKTNSADSTFKSDAFAVAPGTTNLFTCFTNPERGLSGKGTITVYLTKPETAGVSNRISNFLVIEVDIDKQSSKRVKDVP
jgi:hypothetical protein